MHTEGYNENDVVRVTRALQGEDAYRGDPVSVPSGEVGTIVVGEPGDSEYDVEFILNNEHGPYSAVLIVTAEDLAPA